MSEVGTLKELGVGVGDKFKSDSDNSINTYTVNALVDGGVILDWDGDYPATGVKEMYKNTTHIYRIISRATPDPKLWHVMTDEEKGALLLAAHEGKVIEYSANYDDWYCEGKPQWFGTLCYRIKADPKVDTVTIDGGIDVSKYKLPSGHIITFQTIDGKPDCASVKMEVV